ncbi:MAG: FliH/SctL family protein [Xanthobacteraceae bacterium]|jgi:flagellar assembly protein FliH
MTTLTKFLFDVDFGPGAVADKSKQTIPLAAHQAALAEAEAKAYRDGVAAAEATAQVDAQRRTAAALEQIAAGLDRMRDGLRGIEVKLEAESVEVALAVARKLAPELIAREPLAEIAALATECFAQLVATPHVVVRVSDGLYEQARERLGAIAQAHGFAGRLVVLADPTIASADGRIEWADGGIVRDRATTEAVIVEAVDRYVAGRKMIETTGRFEP